jgi:SAM-dependent methyltransferase
MAQSISKRIIQSSLGWDVTNWSRALFFFEDSLKDCELKGKSAIEVGCGPLSGGIGLWLASKGAQIIATSISDVEEDIRRFYREIGLDDFVSFSRWDATLPWEGEKVDFICLKSVLGGVRRLNREQELANLLAELHRALNPGGYLLFIENLVSSRIHGFARARFGAGRSDWHYFSMVELIENIERAGFNDCQNDSTGFLGAFGRTPWQRNCLGWIDGFICRLIPRSLHYVGYGVAKKK